MLIATHLAHIDFLDETIAQLSQEIAERLRPVEAELERLDTIPGVGRRTAEVLAAEIGLDMGRCPSAGHLASWAGMCPGHYESAGKRKGGKTRKGSKWLRRALTEALVRLANDGSLRATLAANAARRAEAMFGLDTMIDRFRAVVEESVRMPAWERGVGPVRAGAQ